MQGSSNTVGGSNNGTISYPSGDDGVRNDDEVVENKGVDAELYIGLGSKDDFSSEGPVKKSIADRQSALNKIKGFGGGIGGQFGKDKYDEKMVASKVDDSDDVSIEEKMPPAYYMRRVVTKFKDVVEELAKDKDTTKNSVISNIDNGIKNQNALPESGLDDVCALTDEISVNTPESKPAAQAIKSYSRLWVCFQKIKRCIRSLMIKDESGVKAKDFRAISANIQDVLKGTACGESVDKYNVLRNQLVNTDKSSEESIKKRESLKAQLLIEVRQMEEGINDIISGSKAMVDSACSEMSSKDKNMLAEKLRSRIGFNLSALKSKE